MATVSTNIRIDENVKTEASKLFEGLGLSLSDAVNVFLRQSILHRGVPFKIEYPEENPNKELRAAIREAKKIEKNPERYKSYKNFDDLAADL
ncbi:MAG: type II toxin-antitoxin system RelB/DinJ family antitoxin [Treponema sp.]|nr:type II toxin-antitoxin system RelB/DinJ family antitoxin [Treponema sp.]